MMQEIILFVARRNVIPFAILLLVSGFNAIVFIQSGLDKLTDFKGNLEWMSEQFRNCFLKNSVAMSIRLLIFLELLSGLLNVGGIIVLAFLHRGKILFAGYVLTGFVLLMLLFGQRVSKNYAGAVSLTGYFLVNALGLVVMCMLSR